MNYTEKKQFEKEFEEKFTEVSCECGARDLFDFSAVKSFLSTSIDQAVAEERARLVGEIKEMAEPYDGAKWLNQIDPERLIKRILSLDTNLK